MRLLNIKVEQLRQFRQPFELSHIAPGLNLFAGPNEVGKSTLVRAIRAAFFERHRSTSVDDLLPWGEPSATPTVDLSFEVEAQSMHLRKAFLNKKRCELKVGTKQYDGEDAERYLAELLGFEFPGRGPSRPEHWGIPGLLWIEQGTGQDITQSVGNATDHLRKALDQSVDEVASSQGDDVMTAVRAQRDALLTSTGRPRAAYAEALAERDTLATQAVELDQRISLYQQQVDQLGSLSQQDTEDQRTRPWESFRIQQALAEGRMVVIEERRRQLADDRAAQAQLKEKQKLIEDQLHGLDAQQKDLRAREQALLETQALAASQRTKCESWDTQRLEAQAAHVAAGESLEVARQEDWRAELTRRMAEAEASERRITETLAKATAEQGRLVEFQKLANETLLSKNDMTRLREQQAKLSELRIRQEAAATRLRFNLQSGGVVTLAGQALSGQGEQLITVDSGLQIQGVGEFRIIPGGTDLTELAREERELLSDHQARLQRVGLATMKDAEARYESHQQALLDAKHADRALSQLAPDGIDALRAEAATASSRRVEAQGLLSQLPSPPPQPFENLAAATRRYAAASTHLETVTKLASEAQMTLLTMQTRHESALRERDALLNLLAAPERQERQRDANQNLLNVRAEHDALSARAAALQAELDAARPDILAQDIERFRLSAEQNEKQFRERSTTITVLRAKLEEAGAQGLEERRGELAAKCEVAQRRVKELKLRAEALDLLVNLLDAKRQALTKRLQAPLQKHMQRYLQLLFPQATLDISEDMTPGRLTRPGTRGQESGDFDAMSFGAREQIGVISRLAYADLLKEAGRPTLVILDDALVHSDEQRLEQMKRVLFDASQRHQVLLFTCHPAAWQGLGVSPRSIGRP